MKKKFLTISLVFLFLFLSPGLIQSAGLVPCGPGTSKDACEFCDFFVLFKNIVDFLLKPPTGLIWPIAILMIAIGGFMYVIAFVNPEAGPGMLTRAKAVFTTTAYGLLIMFSAWIVINLFFQIIGVQEWTNLRQWWVINCP